MQQLGAIILSGLLVMGSCFGMEESLTTFSEAQISKLESVIFLHEHDKCKAIIENNPAIVNADIKAWVGGFFKPLHLAVEKNNIFATELFLKMNASVNQKTTSNYYTPLHMARSKEMVKLLLKHGADVKSIDWRQATPLYHMLFFSGGYHYGRRNIDIIQRCDGAHCLIKRGANINQPIDNQGNSLLHYAVEDNNPAITKFLLQHHADINHKNKDDKTALEKGIFNWSNRQSTLKAFRDKGIICCREGVWPNFFESLRDNAKVFKEYMNVECFAFRKIEVENMIADIFTAIQQNKNASTSDNKIIKYEQKGYCLNNITYEDLEQWVGKDAIDYIKKHLNDRCYQALSLAVSGEYKKLKDIVSRYPYVLSYDKQIAFQLVHWVMMSGDKDAFAWLLGNNPDLGGVSKVTANYCYNNSLLHEAIVHKKAYAIELLIKNNSSLTVWNACSKSPIALLYAMNDKDCIQSFNNAFAEKIFSTYSYQSYYQEIKKFLKTGFNINSCDKDGKTLLQRAVQAHPEKCSLLLKHGATVTQEIIDKASSTGLCAMLQKK